MFNRIIPVIVTVLSTCSLFAGNIDRSCLSPLKAIHVSKEIKIDGDISEWNMTASQCIYADKEVFPKENMEFAFFYDKNMLYFIGDVADTTPLMNVQAPSGRFWEGDAIQLRLFTEKNSKIVPQSGDKNTKDENKVIHCAFYHQSTTGKNFALFDYSFQFKNRKENPAGVKLAFKEKKDKSGYTFEVAIPLPVISMDWTPKNGDFIHGVVEPNFGDASGKRRIRHLNGMYSKNPGDFAFLGGSTWGTLIFSDKMPQKREWPSRKELISLLVKDINAGKTPIVFEVKANAKVTVNIYDNSGKLIREICSDGELKAGKHSLFWDGKDNYGKNVPFGKYQAKIILYSPIKAEYQGSVASSGTPPYENSAGTGAWGGDHSNPLAVSSDKNGYTFLWPLAEMGRAIVHLDKNFNTQWRRTPFFDAVGNLYAIASDGDYIYLINETVKVLPHILRISEKNGVIVNFQANKKAIKLPVENFAKPICPADKRAVAFNLSAPGLAVDKNYIYVAIYPDNKILILDKTNAKIKYSIDVVGPRGLALNSNGDLLIASYSEKSGGAIYKINNIAENIIQKKAAPTIFVSGLDAPWGITLKRNGNVIVSDLGASQQLKEFMPDGKLLKVYGKKGGRALAGKYKAGSFLRPAGLTATEDGGVILAEHSLPSVITKFNAGGEVEKQWFGPSAYAHAVWADTDDPYKVYSYMHHGILRSILNPSNKSWHPDAYWMFEGISNKFPASKQSIFNIFSGFPQFNRLLNNFTCPQIVKVRGVKLMSSDLAAHPIVRIDDDKFIPVAFCEYDKKKKNINLWSDLNGNAKVDNGEISILDSLIDHSKKYSLVDGMVMNDYSGSHTLSKYTGNWYIAGGRRIYKIPLKEIKNNIPIFDAKKATVFINDVTGEMHKPFWPGCRYGILGMREDSKGNLYVVYTYWGRSMGIGHSSDITKVFIAKFDSTGKRIWTSGRKASSFAKPGEIYNPWIMAGIIGDKLIAISDETGGMIHFYDTNGFYRWKIFNDYARGDSSPGPYLFSGENFSGRVQFFPKLHEAFAYQGMTDSRVFKLSGWDKPVSEITTNVILKHYAEQESRADRKTVVINRVANIPANISDSAFWQKVGKTTMDSGNKKLAEIALAIDAENLAFRVKVNDKTPLLNSASSPELAFKGGDAVDLYFGKYSKSKHKSPDAYDIRIMAAVINDKPVLMAMRPISTIKKVQNYSNPGGYAKHFDYVGEIPGAKLIATKFNGGYVLKGIIPLEFLKPLVFEKGRKIAFDVDVLSSDGAGSKTALRSFLFSSGDSVITMTQDIPTECWLYPELWGTAEIK